MMGLVAASSPTSRRLSAARPKDEWGALVPTTEVNIFVSPPAWARPPAGSAPPPALKCEPVGGRAGSRSSRNPAPPPGARGEQVPFCARPSISEAGPRRNVSAFRTQKGKLFPSEPTSVPRVLGDGLGNSHLFQAGEVGARRQATGSSPAGRKAALRPATASPRIASPHPRARS